MINIVLILAGILFTAVLFVWNSVVEYPAHVIFKQSRAHILVLVAVCVGIMMWIWIRGFLTSKKEEVEDDF